MCVLVLLHAVHTKVGNCIAYACLCCRDMWAVVTAKEQASGQVGWSLAVLPDVLSASSWHITCLAAKIASG